MKSFLILFLVLSSNAFAAWTLGSSAKLSCDVTASDGTPTYCTLSVKASHDTRPSAKVGIKKQITLTAQQANTLKAFLATKITELKSEESID